MKLINMYYLYLKNGYRFKRAYTDRRSFLIDERMARLEELESILYQANFSTAEKFEKFMKLYKLKMNMGEL